jgi:hypothetical protein
MRSIVVKRLIRARTLQYARIRHQKVFSSSLEMGDDGEEAPPYVWVQLDPPEDEAAQTANFVKVPGRYEQLSGTAR